MRIISAFAPPEPFTAVQPTTRFGCRLSGRYTRSLFAAAGLLFGLLFAPVPRYAAAQIGLAPTILFIHESDPQAHLTVRNDGQFPQEVTVGLRFAYPTTDADGMLFLSYDDEEAKQQFSISDYVRAFPRRFVLQPGEFQRVRIQVEGLNNRPDGLYWTRVEVTSTEQSPDVMITAEEGLGARINYRIRQNLGLFYHQGRTMTELIPERITVTPAESGVLLAEMALASGGNSPFLGTVEARVSDLSGNIVYIGEWLFSVYSRRIWVNRLEVGELPPGRYQVEFTFSAQRSDVAPGDLPTGQTVSRSLFLDL